MDAIIKLFDRLDEWRHFPKYQLERRADIFFSLYLQEALEEKLGFRIRRELIPEFPIRKATIGLEAKGNESVNMDYLAISEDGLKAVFVELKTDRGSRRSEQDDCLILAKDKGLAPLLQGIKTIFRDGESGPRGKYLCLIEQLAQMSLLSVPPGLSELVRGTNARGYREVAEEIQITCRVQEHQIIYVQPIGDEPGVISFDQFRRVVERRDDAMSRRFAKSLVEWAQFKPGEGR